MPAHRKPRPEAAELYSLYVVKQLTLRGIGDLCDVTQATVRNWLVEASVPIRTKKESAHLFGTCGIRSPAHRIALSTRQRGEKHWNWKGGVSSEGARLRASSFWHKRRHECYARDNWLCQDCQCKCTNTRDSKTRPKQKIQAHHIIGRRDGGSDSLSNLITLCMSCHHRRERNAIKE